MRFNAEEQTKNIIDFIKSYYQENNLGEAVIGISGGKNSVGVTGLFTKAFGPEKVLYKAPNDGLSNQTDEEKLGFTYDEVAKVINNEPVSKDTKQKILKKHQATNHKFNIPIYKRN